MPPHEASVVTFFVGVEAEAEEERVEEDGTAEDTRIDVADEAGLEVAPLPVHVPNAELQPVPQCAVVEPQ